METPENAELVNKLDTAFGSEEKISGQTITVSDNEKSDGFVTIDFEHLSRGINKDVSPNSRFKLQRSVSRKGYQRSNEKNISPDTNGNNRDNFSTNSSPKGSSTLEKTAMVGASVDSVDPTVSNNPQQVHHHHQITITTSNIITAPTERRLTSRKNSFRRSSHFWPLDPKKVMIFFATLSSIGTIMLIILTLSTSQPEAETLSKN